MHSPILKTAAGKYPQANPQGIFRFIARFAITIPPGQSAQNNTVGKYRQQTPGIGLGVLPDGNHDVLMVHPKGNARYEMPFLKIPSSK